MTIADERASELPGAASKKRTLVVRRPEVAYREFGTDGSDTQFDEADDSTAAFYLSVVSELHERIQRADVGNPEEFHGLLWLTMSLGAKQSDVAEAAKTRQTVVSRWVHGGTTPEPQRRLTILMGAWESLESELAKQVPFTPLRGRRAAIRNVPKPAEAV